MFDPRLRALYFILYTLYFIHYTLGLDFFSIVLLVRRRLWCVTASCFEFSLRECSASCLLYNLSNTIDSRFEPTVPDDCRFPFFLMLKLLALWAAASSHAHIDGSTLMPHRAGRGRWFPPAETSSVGYGFLTWESPIDIFKLCYKLKPLYTTASTRSVE